MVGTITKRLWTIQIPNALRIRAPNKFPCSKVFYQNNWWKIHPDSHCSIRCQRQICSFRIFPVSGSLSTISGFGFDSENWTGFCSATDFSRSLLRPETKMVILNPNVTQGTPSTPSAWRIVRTVLKDKICRGLANCSSILLWDHYVWSSHIR